MCLTFDIKRGKNLKQLLILNVQSGTDETDIVETELPEGNLIFFSEMVSVITKWMKIK